MKPAPDVAVMSPRSGDTRLPSRTPLLQTKSLREQVYDYLRAEMNRGGLDPGAFLDLNAIAQRLGISRTPLRDALLQLEVEGYMEIQPRRGFRLKMLTIEEIRHIYQIVGALESAAVMIAGPRIGKAGLAKMKAENLGIYRAIQAQDYGMFYLHNSAFHGVFLDGCANPRMAALIKSLKQRLYDWPRRKVFLKTWEVRLVKDHEDLIALLEAGNYKEAGALLREVHWCFDAQEDFIRVYYLTDLPE
ncbi:GntR family transcriptional regulator [Geothrix limicola]|nr:GntR family transcriptional regulator [Geothrix limicola]